MAELEHVDIAAIQNELRDFFCAAGPYRPVEVIKAPDGSVTETLALVPGIYWSMVRTSLKRLRQLLPRDPDVCDADWRLRGILCQLKRYADEVWSTYSFDDMPIEGPPGEPVDMAPEWGQWALELSCSDLQQARRFDGKLEEFAATTDGATKPTAPTIESNEPTYLIAEIRAMAKVGNDTLNKYAEKAGLQKAGRGRKDFRRPHSDVLRIFQVMQAEATNEGERNAAAMAIASLMAVAKSEVNPIIRS
jgi:hypothetical protein